MLSPGECYALVGLSLDPEVERHCPLESSPDMLVFIAPNCDNSTMNRSQVDIGEMIMPSLSMEKTSGLSKIFSIGFADY